MAGERVEVPTKFCSSCKQDVPVANFEMHSVHCKRFLTCCPHCKEPVNKKLLEEHIEEFHVKIKCVDCGENLEKMELEAHKETSCKRRSQNCEYCEISLPASDMDEHREACGSRTEPCETCKKRILVKDLEDHISTGCQAPDIRAESNDKPSVHPEASKLENLYYSNPRQSGPVFGSTGFPLSPQFLDSKYTEQHEVSQLFESYLNHEDDALTNGDFRVPPIDNAFTPFITRTDRNTTTFPRSLRETRPRNESHSVATYGEKSQKSKFSHSNPKKPIDPQELPAYGIPDPDSDSDDVSSEEKEPFPSLVDDTFLPCEFCGVLLPSDSIAFHQATCQELPPTPRPKEPPCHSASYNTPPLNPRAASFNARGVYAPLTRIPAAENGIFNPPSPEQASGFTSSRKKVDIDEGSAPCEFCYEPFPLDALTVHQISCSENPNLERFQSGSSPERRRGRFPPPVSKSHPPKSATKLPSSSFASQAKPAPSNGANLSLPRRDKRGLAPAFKNKSSDSPEVETSNRSLPKTKTSFVDNHDTERKMTKSKGNSKPPNCSTAVKTSTTVPRTFHEDNNVGSDTAVRVDQKNASAIRKPATNDKHSYYSQNGKLFNAQFSVESSNAFKNGGMSSSQVVPGFVNERKVLGRGNSVGTGKGGKLANHWQPTNPTHSRNTRNYKPSSLHFRDAPDNFFDRPSGNAGVKKSYDRPGSNKVPHGQFVGGLTATIQKQGSDRRKPLGSTQHRERGELRSNERGQDGRRPPANVREESWEETSIGRPRGYRQGSGSGRGGSRGRKIRNPHSQRQSRH